jgi:hypothetical protein
MIHQVINGIIKLIFKALNFNLNKKRKILDQGTIGKSLIKSHKIKDKEDFKNIGKTVKHLYKRHQSVKIKYLQN